MHHVVVKRMMGESDIAALSHLIEAASHEDGHRALGEHKWLDLVGGGRAGFAGFVASEQKRGRLIGYAQLSKGDESWAVEYVVHPAHREEAGLRIELVSAALREIADQGGGHVHLWVPKPDAVDDAVASELGLKRGRDLYQMRRRLPVDSAHSSILTRPFAEGSDEDAWLVVNNGAFLDHPEQGSWTRQELEDRERQPWFDPGGFLLHEVDGKLAGFCWTKIQDDDHDEGEIGEIYVIAVSPNFQGRGLGKELVLAGLEHLAGKGLSKAMLYVDRDNDNARAMYAALGFADDHIDRAYIGDIGAGGAGRQIGERVPEEAPS
ncbi:MAG: mycothiol synthase [Acidimicrobiales bacterium]